MRPGRFCFFPARGRFIQPAAGNPVLPFLALSVVLEPNILTADCNDATGAGCP
jgi:hypothetical protein